MFDRAFREYLTHIRAGILAKKLECCSDFTFKDKSKALNNMNTKLLGKPAYSIGQGRWVGIPDLFGTTTSTACRTQEYNMYGNYNPFKKSVDSLPYFKGLVDEEVLAHS